MYSVMHEAQCDATKTSVMWNENARSINLTSTLAYGNMNIIVAWNNR